MNLVRRPLSSLCAKRARARSIKYWEGIVWFTSRMLYSFEPRSTVKISTAIDLYEAVDSALSCKCEPSVYLPVTLAGLNFDE